MRLCASQRWSCASSQTLAIVISSLAPGAAATKCWNARSRVSSLSAGAAELRAEPLLQRRVGSIVIAHRFSASSTSCSRRSPRGRTRATAVLLGHLAHDRAAPRAAAAASPSAAGDRRLADAALAGDVEQRAARAGRLHRFVTA